MLCGYQGMVEGQMLDMLSNKDKFTLERTRYNA